MQSIFSNEDGRPQSPLTPKGYFLDEVKSALQKEIRRGKEYEAVFWARELESFNKETGSGITMVWNRLRVIASEDVGIANPIAPVVIEVLAFHYNKAKEKKKDDSHRLFLVNAVLFLAKCPKSRLTDDLLVTVYGNAKFKNEKLEMPDYALDIHTLRGRRMGRGYNHFFEIGTQLSNEAKVNCYKETAKQIVMKYGAP